MNDSLLSHKAVFCVTTEAPPGSYQVTNDTEKNTLKDKIEMQVSPQIKTAIGSGISVAESCGHEAQCHMTTLPSLVVAGCCCNFRTVQAVE